MPIRNPNEWMEVVDWNFHPLRMLVFEENEE